MVVTVVPPGKCSELASRYGSQALGDPSPVEGTVPVPVSACRPGFVSRERPYPVGAPRAGTVAVMAHDRHEWLAELAGWRSPHRTDSSDRLVLLGTSGGSNPKAARCGFSNAVVVGDAAYLVDCGEGVHRQLWRAGLTATRRWGEGAR